MGVVVREMTSPLRVYLSPLLEGVGDGPRDCKSCLSIQKSVPLSRWMNRVNSLSLFPFSPYVSSLRSLTLFFSCVSLFPK